MFEARAHVQLVTFGPSLNVSARALAKTIDSASHRRCQFFKRNWVPKKKKKIQTAVSAEWVPKKLKTAVSASAL